METLRSCLCNLCWAGCMRLISFWKGLAWLITRPHCDCAGFSFFLFFSGAACICHIHTFQHVILTLFLSTETNRPDHNKMMEFCCVYYHHKSSSSSSSSLQPTKYTQLNKHLSSSFWGRFEHHAVSMWWAGSVVVLWCGAVSREKSLMSLKNT